MLPDTVLCLLSFYCAEPITPSDGRSCLLYLYNLRSRPYVIDASQALEHTNGNNLTIMDTIKQIFSDFFNLSGDNASMEEIAERIKSGSALKGSNMYILILAIFIASIGLNMNSTAVIIGAMLISPLMGNIIAIGYGMAAYDIHCVKTSCLKLSFQVILSVITSTVYFHFTPITTVSSELLARTSPTIWDVLIAVFGGLAGIIGLTRQERGNVIPGVAIATALMPPLCTAGYGIATHSADFFLGALYLFFINGFFICFSSFIILKLMQVPTKEYVSEKVLHRTQTYLICAGIIVALPSLYMAQKSVRANLENVQAKRYVDAAFTSDVRRVVSYNLQSKDKIIDVALIGKALTPAEISILQEQLLHHPLLNNFTLRITQNSHEGMKESDVQALIDNKLSELQKTGIKSDDNPETIKYKTLSTTYYPAYKKENTYKELAAALNLKAPLAFPHIAHIECGEMLSTENKAPIETASASAPSNQPAETAAAAPNGAITISAADAVIPSKGGSQNAEAGDGINTRLLVIAYVNQPLSQEEAQRLQSWLSAESERPVTLHLQMAADYDGSVISGDGLKN